MIPALEEHRELGERLVVVQAERDEALAHVAELQASVGELTARVEVQAAELRSTYERLGRTTAERDALRSSWSNGCADVIRLTAERADLRRDLEQALHDRGAARAEAERLSGELRRARS